MAIIIYNDGKIIDTLPGYFRTINNMMNIIIENPRCMIPNSICDI